MNMYIAIEFMPTTSKGNVQLRPTVHVDDAVVGGQEAAPPSRPLKIVQTASRSASTIGQTPDEVQSQAERDAGHAADGEHAHLVALSARRRATCRPASRPKIIVASEGTKFSVR